MTIFQTVAIRDTKSDTFNLPAHVQSVGIAIRSFSDEVNRVDGNNAMNRHPADFSLYLIGSYDDQTGLPTPLPQPQLLIQADQCINTGQQTPQVR